jgi:protein-tyrosine phosphatase
MRKVDVLNVWIGTAADARDARSLFDVEIAAVVDLAHNEPVEVVSRDLAYLRFPLIDGGGNPDWLLFAAIRAVADLMRAGVPTLVACGAGMSRSPCIVAAALATVEQSSIESSLRRVCSGAKVDVSPALWSDVERVVCDG